MTRRTLKANAWLLGAVAMAACTNTPDFKPGATEFVTEEPSYSGSRNGFSEGDEAAPTAATPGGNKDGAPSGRSGTVEEADIYRVDANRLYLFNTYRGFMIYDLNDTAHPKQISRLPVYGYPVEMYVSGTTVYALIRDALYLTQDGGTQKFTRHDTSQLVTIDVSDVEHPRVLKTIDIIGKLKEGVSRKIDDTIYVVSSIPQNYYGWYYDWGWYGEIDTTKEQAWVYSFNVAAAENPVLVDKLKIFEGGGANVSGTTSSLSRYFESVAISATSNTLHVVENWQTYGYVNYSPYSGCGASFSQQEAVVSIVDISDPTGHIRLHTKFDTYGHLGDQFKQTYVYDAASKKGYYYGIFDRREWASSNCSGTSFIQNNFEAWDITDGAAPVRTASLPFGKPNETVGGSTFDPDHRVAYAITSRRIDPLYAIGFSDLAHPTILSAIDGLAGDMSVFRFIDADKKFIMGIGRDNTDECTGFAMGTTNWRAGVAVSIFDVHDTSAIRLVQRACIDVKDAQWVSSEVNSNLDQAHKMIGMSSDGGKNVITVPVSFYKKTTEQDWWYYNYRSAVGMMTWDLAAYDPAKSELEQSVLVNRGSVEHKSGSVRRTIVFTHTGTTNRRMLLNLSDTALSLFDIQDVDHPVAQAEVEVAPDVEELFRFGGHLVEHVRTEGYAYGYDTASVFRVKATGGRIDDTAPVATFTIGQVQRVMKWKDSLVVFRRKADPSSGPQWNGSGDTSQVVVIDLADPAHPAIRSLTDLGASIYPYYRYYCGDFWGGWWWGGYGNNNWVSFDGGLAFVLMQYDYDAISQRSSTKTKLVYLDLRDTSAPKVTTRDLGNRDSLALTADNADPTGFFLSYRNRYGSLSPVSANAPELVRYKYYAQRWSADNGDIAAAAATNVPGQIVRSWKSGDTTLLVTQDNAYAWKPDTNNAGYGQYVPTPRLHLLGRLDDSTASLLDSKRFDGRYLGSLAGEGDRLYVTTQKGYDYYGIANTATDAAPVDNTDHLSIFDTGARLLGAGFDGSIGLSGLSIMGTKTNRLFLNVAGAGVLTVDATNPTTPTGRNFLRTLGWGSHLEQVGDTIYVAAGNFGVFQRSLPTATLAP